MRAEKTPILNDSAALTYVCQGHKVVLQYILCKVV